MTEISSDHNTDHLVAAQLSSHGLRYTAARRLVAGCLAASAGPLSAADLLSAAAEVVPLSSLYRTLGVLESAGVLAREHGNNGIARYELAEWLTGHHHHLVCTNCGEVQDVVIDAETEMRVGSLIDHIADAVGYVVRGHRIDIEGKCSTCAKG